MSSLFGEAGRPDTYSAGARGRPALLRRADSSIEVFGSGLSALRAKSPSGHRLTNLRDDNLHKFIARPMYGGLYLLEPRLRTPRDDDGAVLTRDGSRSTTASSSRKLHGLRRSEKHLKRAVLKLGETAGRENEMLFQLADANSDWNLSFDEFKSMIEARLPKIRADDTDALQRRQAELTSWYGALDANGDGIVDPYEYFMFAVRECLFRAEHYGEQELRTVTVGGEDLEQSAFNILLMGGIEQRANKKYVSRRTFKKLALRLGFGAEVGEKVFENVLVEYLHFLGRRAEAIDPSKSTTAIEATYLLKAIQRQTQQLRPLIIQWMTKKPGNGREAPTKGAIEHSKAMRLGEPELAELRARADRGDVRECLLMLRSILKADVDLCHSLFRAWDTDKSMSIGLREFQSGLSEMGFEAPFVLVQMLFDELDDNGSNRIDFGELKSWLAAGDERFKQLLERSQPEARDSN